MNFKFQRPQHMTEMSHKVLNILFRDGGISHLVATHYNIGDVRREISRLRAVGFKVNTVRSRQDAEGRSYTRWVLQQAA